MDSTEELVLTVLHFLKEENYTETAHMLEKESGIFFNLNYLEELVVAGKFDEAECYFLGFTKLDHNKHSIKIFFEIRKQKYLEALDKKDRRKAVQILSNDLKEFRNINPAVYKEITQLLTLDNFRENAELEGYKDTRSQRIALFQQIKAIVKSNPIIQPKLVLPGIEASRLRRLVNQRILFDDDTCRPPIGTLTAPPVNYPLLGSIKNEGPFLPNAMQSRSQYQAGPTAVRISGRMENPSRPVQHAAVGCGSTTLVPPPNLGALMELHITPPSSNSGIFNQFTNSEHMMKRFSTGQSDEVRNPEPSNIHNKSLEDELPKIVVRSLHQGSNVVSMDFHPEQQTILLVGTDVGDIGIWEVGSSEKLVHKSFKDWDTSIRTTAVQAALSKESIVSVKRCIWSPDGAFVGVAFSENIVHIYSYNAIGELRQHLEIDAHIGGVNDIAFVHLEEKLCAITCGDDKIIKAWDAKSGCKQFTFEGHEAPVYSICPHHKMNTKFIFSIDVDGKIKAWLYNPPVCKADYDAPGHGCTTMAYSIDGSRLFTCGTSKEGEPYLVELDETDGAIKRRYSGFEKQSSEVVKFAITKDRFLAAGDESQIKFWDINNINILSRADAEGSLKARPCLSFNKEGSLLAVTTSDYGIMILASLDGVKLLQMLENRRLIPMSKAPFPNLIGAANSSGPVPSTTVNSRFADEGTGKSKNWKFAAVTDPVNCRSIRLTDPLPKGKIVKLLYTYSGSCLLALDSNAAHKLWMWKPNDWNPSGKVTTYVPPQFWQPVSGNLMINDTSDRGLEVVPCLALSKNDSFLLSASGGKVSLFNMKTFKVIENYMPPPPAATCLAFHPSDNNIIAIGMDDSTIQIFDNHLGKVNMILKGHHKRITGLAFSNALNVLVSSAADAQLCVWNINGWEKCKSNFILPDAGRSPSPLADTRVQFHNINQVQLLVVQESQIAIYDASELECVCHWVPRDAMPAPISSATYSCDSQLVYAGFVDGSIGVFDAEVLRPRCRIAPSAFIPGMDSGNTYPFVIAAHPHDPNQIAVGLTDGGVHVIEPAT